MIKSEIFLMEKIYRFNIYVVVSFYVLIGETGMRERERTK